MVNLIQNQVVNLFRIYSNGYVNNIRKSIKSDKFDTNIATHFPELNKFWLLFGEGEMLNEPEAIKKVPLKHNENELPFQDLTIDKKLDKLYNLLITCVKNISTIESEIKKLNNEKELDKEKSIAKTKSKIEKEILKAESVKVDLEHGDAES